MKKEKSVLYVRNEYYGTEKKEDLFSELYEKHLDVKVTITRKTRKTEK
ncbi:hypothetical protein P4V72_26765 [Bacillus thuringiensis]|nr:hypothetical protein [Bacillus thuringiensis]MEC3572131.1 hypothetical protein [Bacillus thuringiensis]MED2021808.1 hypothetical protein [Bacillus thuringiensis]MED2144727.1 hypothetical protein [Bacillus thuringiensis]MED2517745.1 hypothetical protein [Bacillus thuringiensis]